MPIVKEMFLVGLDNVGLPSIAKHLHVGAQVVEVLPPGGFAEVIKIGGPRIMGVGRNLYLFPSSPLAELRRLPPRRRSSSIPE